MASSDSPALLTAAVAPFAPAWRARLVEGPDGEPCESLPAPFVCGACGSPEVLPGATGGGGTVAGGERWYDICCQRCGVWTEYLHEWG